MSVADLEAANYDDKPEKSLIFPDSLKDLKNLRKQLYSTVEYFDDSYTNGGEKQLVIDTLKDYAVKAFVNTVDHLGLVTTKVNELVDSKVEEVSESEMIVSCIDNKEPWNSVSMNLLRDVVNHSGNDLERQPSKSKKLFKSLLSRWKSKKDDSLNTFLDEY